jgi:hypothetical protein
MNDHTPTPWKLRHNGLNAYIVGGPDDFPCANMPGQGITNEANAAHIVKCVNAYAPMMEALKTLRASCQEALSDDWNRTDDGFEAMIESIDDALRAAEGK